MLKLARGDSARSGNHDEPVLLVRWETRAFATSTCGAASVAGESTLLAGLWLEDTALAYVDLDVSSDASEVDHGGVNPILTTGSVLATSMLLRGLLCGSWESRRLLRPERKTGEEEEPRSSCGRRALGRPRMVLEELAGDPDSAEVAGDRERSIESEPAEGEARPGDPATGETEPILRS